MEEEQKKNKKKLLILTLVLGVILVIAVGGTYAYFSARATNSGSTITGQTLNINGSTLTIAASRLNLNPSPAPNSDNLVPANFGVSPTEITTTQVNRALTKACVNGGYTGCHVWKIEASTTQNVSNANIRLNLNVDNVTDKNEWSYVVYTGTNSSATTIVNKGLIITDFPNSLTTIDIHNDAALTTTNGATYYVMVYLNNTASVQNDGVTTGTTSETGTYNGSVILEAMGGQVRVNFLDDAVEYITNLYNNATKSTATVNSITYSLASSVGLMRDQFGSSSSASNTGNLRYYGADPSNYVWLGDSYTSDYTILGSITSWGYADKAECINDGNNEADCTEDIVRHSGDKKLWRIVGVFDGRLKLVSNDPISTTTGLSWDTSANTTGGNSGWGINQWGPSGTYEGADLMRLLNPGFESESVNNSLYWNKTSSGTVYTSSNNATTSNVSFANTGLTANERSLIDTATWYTGAYDQFSYADAHYNAERGNMGKMCSSSNACDDTVTRTNTWNGKVGLISASDYGYAANLAQCNQTLDNYYETGCVDTNWLKSNSTYWTMSPRADSVNACYVFSVSNVGDLGYDGASNDSAVRPAVFLKSGVSISRGNGSQSNPYVLVG